VDKIKMVVFMFMVVADYHSTCRAVPS